MKRAAAVAVGPGLEAGAPPGALALSYLLLLLLLLPLLSLLVRLLQLLLLRPGARHASTWAARLQCQPPGAFGKEPPVGGAQVSVGARGRG